MTPGQETSGQKISGIVFVVAMLFCGMEMVPGWGLFHLDWPNWVYYLIMAVTGAIAGSCFATDHPLPGLVGGLVAGPGGIFAIAFVLEHSTVTYDIILLVVGLIGLLPGFALYKALAALEDAITGPPRTANPIETRSADPQQLFDPANDRK